MKINVLKIQLVMNQTYVIQVVFNVLKIIKHQNV